MDKKKIWISYSWEDNKDSQVEYIAQELADENLEVNLDKWSLISGKRLWEQIAELISNPEKCDGWILYTTQNSLNSEPCKEEFAYALSRALDKRGSTFPIIGLFPAPVEKSIIPPAIATRLFVSLIDDDWKERIRSSIKGEKLNTQRKELKPFYIKKKIIQIEGVRHNLIEIRPRAGMWSPCYVGIPIQEKNKLSPKIFVAPVDDYSFTGMHVGGEGISIDGTFWLMHSATPATPTSNILLTTLNQFPSVISFGKYITAWAENTPQFQISSNDIPM